MIAPARNLVFSRREHSLDALFAPKTVAVIGASEEPGSVGRTLLWNLVSNPFGGTVFPVNPNRDNVLGIKAYQGIATVPAPVDLAVVATPAATVSGIIGECSSAGVKGAIIISAGFKETGPAGAELERQILVQARRGAMRIIGPNCLGVMSPVTGLNATFAGNMARPGNVAFTSQSGALCTAILDWSLREFVGFSAFVSIGSMLDVGWGDLIGYLGDDPRTRIIILYMESIGDPRPFLSAARQVAPRKPIIVIKAGRTEAAAKAATSHTGALAGSDEVLDAAFRRCGVLRVNNISDLFYMAEVLAKQPRPRGPRLAILTNAGGPGVLATDALIASGGELAGLTSETLASLNQLLPPHWSRTNPVDILGDASPARFAQAVQILGQDSNSDGLLVVLAPQGLTDPTLIAEALKPFSQLEGKPILASWMGGAQIAAGEEILSRANIPTFPYPDTAARAFVYMWRYSYNLRGLYETPRPLADTSIPSHPVLAAEIIRAARNAGRTLLDEFESKQVLGAYGISAVETRAAQGEEDAVRLAAEIGYPVVLKLLSQTITHKTDVGGVHLDLRDADAVRRAYRAIESSVREKAGAGNFLGVTVQPMVKLDGYELIAGSSLDPQFGPVLLFGAGGQLIEILRDRSLALPPLNTTLARRMMEQTRIFRALEGVRGRPPVDLAALEQLMVRFSQLVTDQRSIKEVDINPLLASSERIVALDARIVLHEPSVSEDDLPRTAIRVYPCRYVGLWVMKDTTPVTIRPITPEDEPLMAEFHHTLSEESVHLRYFHALPLGHRVAHERLSRICFIDYDREIVLVVERDAAKTEGRQIIAVGRLTRMGDSDEAEVAVLISDEFQGRGLGTELMRRLLEIGRAENIRRIAADILPENFRMKNICERLGFHLAAYPDDPTLRAAIDL